MTISASLTSYLAATSLGSYTLVDKRGNRTIVTVNSDIVELKTKAKRKPIKYKLLHRLLKWAAFEILKFTDKDLFYK